MIEKKKLHRVYGCRNMSMECAHNISTLNKYGL